MEILYRSWGSGTCVSQGAGAGPGEVTPDIEWQLNDREWSDRNAVALSAGVSGIYLSRVNLDAAFDDNGRQINPLMARLTVSLRGSHLHRDF